MNKLGKGAVLNFKTLLFFIFISFNSIAGEELGVNNTLDPDSTASSSTNTTTGTSTQSESNESSGFNFGKIFRPEIGVGLGYYNFRGEVKPSDSKSIYASSLVYSVYVARKISNSFDFGLRFSTGKMVGNQTGPVNYSNFETIIHSGSANIAYNFSHLLPENSILKPYITVGFTIFEFNSKADLFDANGNRYHYWDDGSIRNIAQGAINSENAQILKRDYYYETDLRKADIDFTGRYNERGLGLPIGLELEFNVTKRVSFRIGAIYTFSSTDYIDNITEETLGSRKGEKGGDHFLQNKISLHYDLFKGRKKMDPSEFEFVDFLALDIEDDDKDGVINEFDMCPFTTEGVLVDNKGCAKDLDEDGVPDHLDKENSSEHGANVTAEGVTYTDQDYLNWFMSFIDSVEVSDKVLSRLANNHVRLSKYRVLLKSYADGDSIPDSEVEKMIAEDELKVFTVQDNATAYAVGEFFLEADADTRMKELQAKGYSDAKIVVIDEGSMMDAVAWNKLANSQMKKRYKGEFEKKQALENLYALRLGHTKAGATAFEKAEYLKDDQVIILNGSANSTDFVVGPFIDTVSAHQNKEVWEQKGYGNIEIVKVRNGRVEDLVVPLVDVEYGFNDSLLGDIADYEKIKDLDGLLVVKVGTIDKNTSGAEIKKLEGNNELVSIFNPDKTMDYVLPVGYSDVKSAAKKSEEFKSKGYESPSVVTVMVRDQRLKPLAEEELSDMFTISLGSFSTGVPSEEVDKILSISDVKKIQSNNPKRDVYTVGKFATKEEAKARLTELIEQGYAAQLVGVSGGKINKVDDSMILSDATSSKKKQNKGNKNITTDKAVFRVQVGAFGKKVPLSEFKGEDVVEFKSENSVYKYLSSGESTYRDGYIKKLKLASLGFKGTFVVAYKDGKKIDIKDLVNDTEFKEVRKELGTEKVTLNVNDIVYKVQVGAFKNFSKEHSKLRDYSDIEMEIYGEYKRILTGKFKSYQEAVALKEKLKASGFPNAFVVAYDGNKRMSLEGTNPNVITKNEGGEDITPHIDKKLHIKIQIGLYRGALPADVQRSYSKLGKLSKEITPEGITKYLVGDFNDPAAATAFKEELKSKGFKGAFLVAFYNGQRIGIKDALEMFKQR